MTDDHQCCCLHVKTCAVVVGIIGLFFAICSLFSAFIFWFNLPLGIALVVVYIFVLVGITKERPSYLWPAQIILGINIVINILGAIALFVCAAVMPDDWVPTDTNNSFDTEKKAMRAGFIFLGVIVLLSSAYAIFAFTVIHRARKYLICHLNSSHPPPIYPHNYQC